MWWWWWCSKRVNCLLNFSVRYLPLWQQLIWSKGWFIKERFATCKGSTTFSYKDHRSSPLQNWATNVFTNTVYHLYSHCCLLQLWVALYCALQCIYIKYCQNFYWVSFENTCWRYTTLFQCVAMYSPQNIARAKVAGRVLRVLGYMWWADGFQGGNLSLRKHIINPPLYAHETWWEAMLENVNMR